MTAQPAGWLVYVPSLRGPAPERWPREKVRNCFGKEPKTIGPHHPLSEAEMHVRLAELERTYPKPEVVS